MKLLVTGGAGFIGTNFVYLATTKGHQVTVLDKLTYAGGRDNLEPIGDRVKLIVGDICDRNIVKEALKDCDCVVHFAAESHVTRSEKDPDIFFRTNVEGTKILLEESFATQIKKFIHISTDEVYGSIEEGSFKESDKLRGDSQASSAYAKSKSLADDLALEFGKKYPVIIPRITNNFGPWQYPEKLLPRSITNLLLGEEIKIWGEGNQVRDWLYAKQTALAVDFLIQKGQSGEAYNIAANNQPEVTNKKAAELLCKILKLDPAEKIEFISDPRKDHDFRYALDTTKIEKLGWVTDNGIEVQFEETIEWYKSNQEWWRKRKSEAESIYR